MKEHNSIKKFGLLQVYLKMNSKCCTSILRYANEFDINKIRIDGFEVLSIENPTNKQIVIDYEGDQY